MTLFIHHTSCISPQLSFGDINLSVTQLVANGKLFAVEPVYQGIPPGALRRMGKAVRMGVGAALPLLNKLTRPDGIIIGTANGGMEDCIKFLNQIIEYDEGQLTPGNFVQSTPNAIAAQIGFINSNRAYNITHVHRGLAFEYSLIDAVMQLKENPGSAYLVGAVEEISTYNYNIDWLDGWYKNEQTEYADLYSSNTPGSVAGEGAAMFEVTGKKENAGAAITAIDTCHSEDPEKVAERWQEFIYQHADPAAIDLFISGENGDVRLLPFYTAIENTFSEETDILRFKHACGEFATASGFAVWLASQVLQGMQPPPSWFKFQAKHRTWKTIAIYNNFKNLQHSFILMKLPVLVNNDQL